MQSCLCEIMEDRILKENVDIGKLRLSSKQQSCFLRSQLYFQKSWCTGLKSLVLSDLCDKRADWRRFLTYLMDRHHEQGKYLEVFGLHHCVNAGLELTFKVIMTCPILACIEYVPKIVRREEEEEGNQKRHQAPYPAIIRQEEVDSLYWFYYHHDSLSTAPSSFAMFFHFVHLLSHLHHI